MAFSRLMLTTDGRILYAKYGQGKAPHFTRVAIGDGVLGTGSLVNRKTLINERLSLPIDAILRINDDTDVAVIATLKNDLLEEGIYFREISVWAKDPDTSKDVLCLIDNAGADAEYIPDANSGVKISERLKLITTVENASNISFDPGGNPLYLTGDDIDDAQIAAYSLWSSKKVSDELATKATKVHTHTPGEAGADPAGSAAAALEAAKLDATTKANQAEENAKKASEKAGATAAHNVNATAHMDIRSALSAAQQLAQEAKSLAEGRSRAVSYTGYSSMVAAVNIMSKTAMRVGDNLLLEALGVPDLWVSKVEATAVIYTYTTDAALEDALGLEPVQMGYYKLTMLETPKVDLRGYVPAMRTINGKQLTGNITLTAGDVGARADTWVPSWGEVTGKPGTFTPSAHTHTPAQAGVGKTLTFTGAASGTYDGTGDVNIKIPEGGGCVLQITFENISSGKAFTVTGAGESYTGTVPANLKADVTVKNVDAEYTVTCDGAVASVTTGPYFGRYAVSVSAASPILNENTWAQIRKVSDAGTGANYWKVGDTKRITINGAVGNTNFSNLAIDAFILGFNHNASREGNNRIHFQIGKINSVAVALVDSNYGNSGSSAAYFQMNASNTNSGGWNGSSMRKTLLGNNGTPTSPPAGSMLAAMPPDLRAVMKSCTKYSDNTGGGSDTAGYVTSTTDYLTLPAEFEYHGVRSYANSAEQNYQAQYEYYRAGNSKIKYRHDATGTAAYSWCRSVFSSHYNFFCLVYTNGIANTNNAYYSYALAPCFFV